MAIRVKNIPVGTSGNPSLKGAVVYADVEERGEGTYVIISDSRQASELVNQYPAPSWRLVPYPYAQRKVAFFRSK